MRSSQIENKIAEIEAKISAAQEQIETRLSPALLLAEEEKLEELETSLSDAEKAEIARIHAAQRGEYILVASGIFTNVILMMMWIYQVRIVRRHWQNLFPVGHKLSRFRYPLNISIQLAILTFAVFMIGFQRILDLPSILELPHEAYGLVIFSLTAAQVTALTFMTSFGVAAYRHNYPDAAEIALHVKTLKENLSEHFDLKGLIDIALFGLGDDPNPPKIVVSNQAQTTATWPAKVPVPPYLDNGLTAATSTQLVALLSPVLGIGYILFIIYVGLVVSFLSADLNATDDLRTALADLSEGWLIAIGTGFTLVLMLVYTVPTSGLAPFVSSPKQSPKLQIKGNQDGFVLLDPPAAPKEKTDKQKHIDQLWHHREGEMGANQEKFSAIINAAHRGGGFHELLDDSLSKHAKTFLGLISPAIAAGALSFLS